MRGCYTAKMPMLADLDDPEPSRARGLVLGLVVMVPLTLGIGYFLLPALRSAIVGGAADLDSRLRREDAYMEAVCGPALVVERDEGLCKCVLGAEYPSLDCHGPFLTWSLDRMGETCADPTTFETALSF